MSFNARPADLFVARFYRLCAAVHCRVIIRSPDVLAWRGENSQLFPHLFPPMLDHTSIAPHLLPYGVTTPPPVADSCIRSVRKTRSMPLAREDCVPPGVLTRVYSMLILQPLILIILNHFISLPSILEIYGNLTLIVFHEIFVIHAL